MKLIQQLTDYVNACFTGLWLRTFEPDEAQREIAALAKKKQWHVIAWDIAQGYGDALEKSNRNSPGDPLAILDAQLSRPGTDATTIVLLHNYHRFLNAPMVVQKLYNKILEGKSTRVFITILSPVVQIPVELEKIFVVLEHELPDNEALTSIMKSFDTTPHEATPEVLNAAAGLTRYEAEGAFALSTARHGEPKPEEIWELKEGMLKKSGLLELHRGDSSFRDLGGLDQLKSFCVRALAPRKWLDDADPSNAMAEVMRPRTVKPKGILLLGVPGTGKSAFAKALGNETKRPTLILDVGSLFGSLVGQTEDRIRQALKIADAMAPCILFVDEIEKALAGTNSSHDGDSGVSKRLFGTLLTWLNDHESDVFFIATCNDITKMPPEFSRAERFDGIFFLDLPTQEERRNIWQLYIDHFGVSGVNVPTASDDSWTGAEIKACCRLAALLGIPLSEAAQNVVPVARTSADKVAALREWASGRCLSASGQGIYHNNTVNNHQPRARRAINREKPSAN
jgi:ATPase family associated with various cellular activities (AAA)